jgi:putative ABC transport system permease protein
MARARPFRRLFGPEPAGDVDAELSFHLDMRIQELVAGGMPPDEARDLALRRFGDYERARRVCVDIDRRRERTMARTEYLTELRHDAAYAIRTLRRAPGFTAVALLTLALGVGANSALFSVVHGVLLQALPFRDADRLYRVRMVYPDGTQYTALSAPDFMSVRADATVFEQVDAYATMLQTLLGTGEPREVRGAGVSDGLFDLLGLRVALGRGFLREENQPGRNRVVVLDNGFWQRAFGGDRGVIGRTVTLGGNPHEIVGILAPGERITTDVDVYSPLEYGPTFDATTMKGRRSEFLAVIGRARAGVAAPEIAADLRRVGTRLQSNYPETNDGLTFSGIPLLDLMVGDVRRPLFVLLGAVGFVLLVACANVANLLLARASARTGELAVRAALGASRARLVRQLLTEAAVLGLLGAAAGLAVSYWCTRALVAAQPADIPRLDQVAINAPVVLFTVAVALLTSIGFGMLPALQARRAMPSGLREGARTGGVGRGHRVRAALVVAEMALAVVLLTGAGLLIRSFVGLMRVDPGFTVERGVAFRVVFQGEAYRSAAQIRDRVAQVEERLRALPGVSAVGITTVLPLSGLGALLDFAVVGAPPPPPNVNQEIAFASVTPDYFTAIGASLKRGRVFSTADREGAPFVAVVNEAAGRRWFPGQDPIGRRVQISGNVYEVVGVVGDVLQRDPGQTAAPQLFAPYAQRTARTVRFVVRTAGDAVSMAPSIRATVRATDPNLAIPSFTTLDQLVTASVARPRFYTALLALFAAVALALAATGIFGVMSYAVAQRTREISIRMALGARAGDVLRLVVGRAVSLAAVGLVLGLAAALALGRVIRGQLFGVSPLDPLTLAVVTLVLGTSAAAASFLPARRAARVDPGTALREG